MTAPAADTFGPSGGFTHGPATNSANPPAARPAEPTGELREQVIDVLTPWMVAVAKHTAARELADALLAGPLAPLLAKLRAVETLADELMTERSLVPDIARRATAERIRRALDAS